MSDVVGVKKRHAPCYTDGKDCLNRSENCRSTCEAWKEYESWYQFYDTLRKESYEHDCAETTSRLKRYIKKYKQR